MAGNFGAGLGSFMSGAMQGYNFAEGAKQNKENQRMQRLKNDELEQGMADRQEGRGIMRQASADAGEMRKADIAKNIQVGAIDQGGTTAPSFKVGGKEFSSQAEAEKEAEKSVGSFMDYYMQTSAPKMMEHWTKTGEIDKAANFAKFMEDDNVKKGAKAWAGAVRSFHMGDSDGFKTNLMKAYNQQGYFDDGMTAEKIDDIKNDKGQLLGYAITFKDQQGNTTTQNYDGDDVARMGLQALAPDQVLSYGLDQLKQAQAAQASMAKEDRSFNRDLSKIQMQQGGTISAQNNKAALDSAAKAEERRNGGNSKKVLEAEGIANALRAQGKDDAYIKAIYPQLLGIERGSKSQNDRLDGYIATMAKSDMAFAELSPSQQVEKAAQMMTEVDKARGGASGQGADSPAAAPVQSAGKGIPMRDSKTGQIIYR